LFLFRKSKFSPSSTFWVLLIPVIIIDLTTFIEGRSLMPLRFPFSTLFPIFGLLGGFLKVSSSKRHFRIFAAFFILFTVISQLYFIPAIIKYMIKRDSKNIPVSPSVIEGEFITINGSTIVIKDTAKAKTILIEYYFVGCVACENKKPYLKKLLEKNQPDKFQVIFICNGSISNFAKFQTHARANDLRGATYLYRKDDESKNKYMPGGYPFEIMLNDKLKITSTIEGFNSEAGAMYVRETQEKINHSK
jgi:hypothetical protein